MRLATFGHEQDGWTTPWLPLLDSEQTLVLVFASPSRRDDPALAELRRAYPRSHLVGCSTAGEIRGATIRDGTLAVAVARLDTGRLKIARTPLPRRDESRAAGTALARSLAGAGLRGALVLADGATADAAELAAGLRAGLPDEVVVAGGLAADGDRSLATWLLDEGDAVRGRAIAVGFYGDAVRFRRLAASDEDEQLAVAGASARAAIGASARAMDAASTASATRGLGGEPMRAASEPIDEPLLSIAVTPLERRLTLRERADADAESSLRALPRGAEQVGFCSGAKIGAGDAAMRSRPIDVVLLDEA